MQDAAINKVFDLGRSINSDDCIEFEFRSVRPNYGNDHTLAWFDAIVPCGLADASVTSMASLLPEAPELASVAESVASSFERVFAVKLLRDASLRRRAAATAEEAGHGR